MRILFVCLGNICRSPLAEGILRNRIEEHDLDWSVDSAGTGYWHAGEAPHEDSQRVARDNDLDISGQRARQFQAEDLDEYDLILTMDRENYSNVMEMTASDDHRQKVDMLLNYLHPGEDRSVPDPYFEGGFEGVYDLLDRAIKRMIEEHTK